MKLLLRNATWFQNDQFVKGDIRIDNGKIVDLGNLSAGKHDLPIDISGLLVLPGLINSHDHLEMNLYPHLGTPPYQNYTQWSADIYKPTQSPLKEIEKTDKDLRLTWGGLKNLISGVTTVVHHNPFQRILSKEKFPVKVLATMSWAHSLAFEKTISKTFPKNDIPYVIHAGEGIDDFAKSEIHKLDEIGLLRHNTVLVHAVAASNDEIEKLTQRKASVIWCPSSNLLMFRQTAHVDRMKSAIKVSLGTDSTLTGPPTLLDEMRVAISTKLATTEDVYQMVSNVPSTIFSLEKPEIAIGAHADLVIVPKSGGTLSECIVNMTAKNIQGVIVNGNPRLIDHALFVKELKLKKSFRVDGATKHSDVDVAELKTYFGKKVGSAILDQNPLWQMIDA